MPNNPSISLFCSCSFITSWEAVGATTPAPDILDSNVSLSRFRSSFLANPSIFVFIASMAFIISLESSSNVSCFALYSINSSSLLFSSIKIVSILSEILPILFSLFSISTSLFAIFLPKSAIFSRLPIFFRTSSTCVILFMRRDVISSIFSIFASCILTRISSFLKNFTNFCGFSSPIAVFISVTVISCWLAFLSRAPILDLISPISSVSLLMVSSSEVFSSFIAVRKAFIFSSLTSIFSTFGRTSRPPGFISFINLESMPFMSSAENLSLPTSTGAGLGISAEGSAGISPSKGFDTGTGPSSSSIISPTVFGFTSILAFLLTFFSTLFIFLSISFNFFLFLVLTSL